MLREILDKYTRNGKVMWPAKSSKTYKFGKFSIVHQGCILEHSDIDVVFKNYGVKPCEVITKAETIIVKKSIDCAITTKGAVKFICCGSNMAAINAKTVIFCLASSNGGRAWYENFAKFKYINDVVKTVIIHAPYAKASLPNEEFNECIPGGIIEFAVNCFRCVEIRIITSGGEPILVNVINVLAALSKPPDMTNPNNFIGGIFNECVAANNECSEPNNESANNECSEPNNETADINNECTSSQDNKNDSFSNYGDYNYGTQNQYIENIKVTWWALTHLTGIAQLYSYVQGILYP
jgi:hypothetical protein